jgi:hypothetical protein
MTHPRDDSRVPSRCLLKEDTAPVCMNVMLLTCIKIYLCI